jgi:hypothetical protein
VDAPVAKIGSDDEVTRTAAVGSTLRKRAGAPTA